MKDKPVKDTALSEEPVGGEPLLRVRGLTKDFRTGGPFSGRRLRALNAVDLDIPRGRIVALVGESGSGKSTLARCLIRLEQPTSGSIVLDGENVLRTEKRRASRSFRGRVQMVFQDPFGSLNPVHTVEYVLARALRVHGRAVGGEQLRGSLRELMATVDLDESMLDSYPHELSGGQRQRIAIARALAVDPRLILADEPTSMLDVSVRIGILNLMRRLRDERGISLLYITHDLASARYVADTTLVMYAGELVEGGDALQVMAAPAHPYTKLLLSAVPDPARSDGYDPVERARLRAAVLDPSQCPYEGDPDQPCSGTEPVRHRLDDTGHWVRCLRYSPTAPTAATALTADPILPDDLLDATEDKTA
ncbi:ABC transporter ATP-binding protein [Streptomyces sp.]|uniref:ABC transporter ATP-binding protein n=1 Tax=Streptomyces sp. TaxID=1931 RepID=UPI0039C97312